MTSVILRTADNRWSVSLRFSTSVIEQMGVYRWRWLACVVAWLYVEAP